MQTPRHLLVSLDLTPGGLALTPSSRHALDEALTLASEWNARLDVVHSTAVEAFEIEDHYALVHSGVSDEGRAVLDGVMNELEARELPGQVIVSGEKPWIALAKQVLEHGADLVVVGRRDASERPGLGRVSKKIVHVVPAAVWVVQGRGVEHPRPERVVVATDLSDVGQRAIEAAALVAKSFRSELHVTHAFQIPISLQLGSDDRGELIASLGEKARIAVTAQCEAAGALAEAKVHVGNTTPIRAIEESIEHLKADLLVLGTISREGISGFLIGNVAEKVLGEVRTSILTVKPEGFECRL